MKPELELDGIRYGIYRTYNVNADYIELYCEKERWFTAVNTTINNLDEAIADKLEDYSTAITNAVNEQTEKGGKSTKKDIAADSPVKTGKQRKSRGVTKEKVAGA